MSIEDAPSDRTYSTTGCSAHCIARCRMVVSSSPPPAELETLNLLPSVSRMAFEIDAVSPLRRASNILNFLTDCSMDSVLSADGGGGGMLLGICTLEIDRINPAVPVEGLEAWPLDGCFDSPPAEGALRYEEESLSESVAPSLVLSRFNLEKAEDLLRLWLKGAFG